MPSANTRENLGIGQPACGSLGVVVRRTEQQLPVIGTVMHVASLIRRPQTP
jgi:hypothetical protein